MLAILLPVAAAAQAPNSGGVATYHDNPARTGNFVVPGLTWERARTLRPDPDFRARISGHVYAQPLYWQSGGGGAARLIVATESNRVYALDAASGRTVWERTLGPAVPLSELPCGNIDPLGVTGTPVIDGAKATLYLDAMVRGASGAPDHRAFALSLADGTVRPGWPVSVAARLKAGGERFIAANQNERGALVILGDRVYVPYGGHFGDCGAYHGWVVGLPLDRPDSIASWHTPAAAGGIWAPAGIASDGTSLFVSTGNTMDARRWSGGEAVIRLDPALRFSGAPKDFFTPPDWQALDERDADLGGVAPVLFEAGGRKLVLALGKDGKAYLLDRRNLGGIGGSLAAVRVSSRAIRTAAAEYPARGGAAMVAFQGRGSNCPSGTGGQLTVLRIGAAPLSIATAWCGAVDGAGAPIVTTTDGAAQPIVWMLGAEGDDRLYGFRGDTGQRIFLSAPLAGLRHFDTLIATRDRLYVAADNAVYAFVFR